MRAIVAAVHGIMTKQTTTSWPDKLDAWMMRRDAGIKVIKKEYAAGPWPKWNCLVKDPKLARGLVEEIKLLLQAAPYGKTPIWIVAHSNGAIIALKATKLLISEGYRVAGLILTGAACDSDVDRTGVWGWVESGDLGCAVAFCSADDAVLRKVSNPWTRFLTWPYGDLGRRGWTAKYKGDPSDHIDQRDIPTMVPFGSDRIRSQWFCGGHSCYFLPGKINDTFERMHSIIRAERRATHGGGR